MATRPSQYPRWATSGVKTQPTSAQQSQGWGVGQKPPAQVDNWWKDLADQWVEYQDSTIGFGLWGDFSDGSATLDGVATVGWAVLAGSTYTLSRDVNLVSLSLTGTATIETNGYRLYGNSLTLASAANVIDCSGSAGQPDTLGGAGGTGGGAGGSLGAGANGGAGGVGGGTAGSNSTSAKGGGGGSGGAGGGAGGTGGTAAAVPASRGSSHSGFGPCMGFALGMNSTTPTLTGWTGGAGGGGGGGSSGQPGGGGGGGGGVIMLAFRTISLPAATCLMAAGGGGGGVTVSGRGGGGGGGGGYIRIVCETITITSGTLSSATNCPGGAGGTGGGGTNPGAAGSSGILELVPLGTLGPGAPLPTVHVEKGVINMSTGGSGAGFDFGVASFSSNFAALPGSIGGYVPYVFATPTDAAVAPPALKVTFALNQMTITPVEQFNGIISWRAEL
jgi:hypothetical protein